METLNAKMTYLIVNYLVNQGFYGLDSRGEGTPHQLDDHFKAISRHIGSVVLARVHINMVFGKHDYKSRFISRLNRP